MPRSTRPAPTCTMTARSKGPSPVPVHGVLDEFRWPLRREFRFLIVKAGPDRDFEDDLGLDHYDGDELDLGRLAREQALLALDDSGLCSEACRGLCAHCGANLNRETCDCPTHDRH